MVNLTALKRYGWPKQAKQTFKYGRRFELIMGSGASLPTLTVRANGPQDPEFAVGGDNAYGWDEFMGAMYDKCYCYAAKIKVTYIPLETTSYYGGCHVQVDTMTGIATVELAMNQPGEEYKAVTQYAEPKTITKVINVERWLPFSTPANLICTATTNPTDAVRFVIWSAQANPSSVTSFTMVGDYEIEYYCILGQTDIVGPSV